METTLVIQEESKTPDPYEVENTQTAFAAEQSVPQDADMQTNPEYDDVAELGKQLEGLQIKMVGQDGEEEHVEDDQSEDELDDILNKQPEDFKLSKKH